MQSLCFLVGPASSGPGQELLLEEVGRPAPCGHFTDGQLRRRGISFRPDGPFSGSGKIGLCSTFPPAARSGNRSVGPVFSSATERRFFDEWEDDEPIRHGSARRRYIGLLHFLSRHNYAGSVQRWLKNIEVSDSCTRGLPPGTEAETRQRASAWPRMVRTRANPASTPGPCSFFRRNSRRQRVGHRPGPWSQ